jgi:hypothetical protein
MKTVEISVKVRLKMQLANHQDDAVALSLGIVLVDDALKRSLPIASAMPGVLEVKSVGPVIG